MGTPYVCKTPTGGLRYLRYWTSVCGLNISLMAI